MAPSTTLEILRLRAKNLENWCGQQRTALWVGSLVLSIITLLATAEEPKSSYTTPLPTGVRLDPAGEFIDQPIRNSEYFAGCRVSRSFSEQYRLDQKMQRFERIRECIPIVDVSSDGTTEIPLTT